jgi:hypothetical protein
VNIEERLKEATVPLQVVLDQVRMEQKHEALKLCAQALEFLAEITPLIPGASVTLTPAQQDELRQIILALPLMVAV